MGSFNDQSLGDCQNRCVTTVGCESIGFHEPNGDPSFTNCQLKDTVLTSLSSFVTKENWTTYYCTIARKIIRIIENQNLFTVSYSLSRPPISLVDFRYNDLADST